MLFAPSNERNQQFIQLCFDGVHKVVLPQEHLCATLMLQEQMSCNAGLEIIQLTKFTNARNFKFVCKEAYMANNCLNHGIRMFDMSFPARMLSAQKPKVINLQRPTFCFRCYAINDHSVRDCPKPPEFTICSECSSTNHSWQNCTSTTKKCLNCSGGSCCGRCRNGNKKRLMFFLKEIIFIQNYSFKCDEKVGSTQEFENGFVASIDLKKY